MQLEDLYNLIPDFLCTAGCHACCEDFGVPSRTPEEDDRIKAFLKQHSIRQGRARGNTCPYLVAAGCSIYPVRPFICRLYGTSPNYRCKMNVSPVRLMHEDEEADIFHLYQTHFFT